MSDDAGSDSPYVYWYTQSIDSEIFRNSCVCLVGGVVILYQTNATCYTTATILYAVKKKERNTDNMVREDYITC